MDGVQDVPDSLRFLYELHGESGTWQESPLYGRRTGQFKIEPLNYKETAVFHPNLSAEDNSLIYGITGGVPHYINKLDVKDSVDEALLDNFFDRSSYLYEEPGNLLKQDSGSRPFIMQSSKRLQRELPE